MSVGDAEVRDGAYIPHVDPHVYHSNVECCVSSVRRTSIFTQAQPPILPSCYCRTATKDAHGMQQAVKEMHSCWSCLCTAMRLLSWRVAATSCQHIVDKSIRFGSRRSKEYGVRRLEGSGADGFSEDGRCMMLFRRLAKIWWTGRGSIEACRSSDRRCIQTFALAVYYAAKRTYPSRRVCSPAAAELC